ncbi:MAG: hypothetical protein Q8P52_00985 [bacterium]|nr:hypothetical protein [bacterium]
MSYETRFRWISFQFRARRSKNYEAYTEYLLSDFCKAAAEIEKKDADLEFCNSKCLNTYALKYLKSIWHIKQLAVLIKILPTPILNIWA